jgi:thymidylate synthase
MLPILKVKDIRDHFKSALATGNFVTDKTGVKTIELVGASFLADEDAIFGDVNWDYVRREIEWYDSQSLKVTDIRGGAPKIWQMVSSKNGEINSNYGWAIYSSANQKQYWSVMLELLANPNSRRAVMIYTRPTMHSDYNRDGMSDFMCTNAVQYMIRNDNLHAVVQMRSNDVVFGYKNDRAWQHEVMSRLLDDLNTKGDCRYGMGTLTWQVGSLHVYSRHFSLIDPNYRE